MSAVLVVAAAPLIFVWLSDLGDSSVGKRMRHNVESTATEAGRLLADPGPAGPMSGTLEGLAWRNSVWLRVVDEGGALTTDLDEEGLVAGWFGDVFFGPDGAPSLEDFDTTLPPLQERAVVKAATTDTPVSECSTSAEGSLLVCHAATRVETPDGPALVYVQESSRRAIRALYDVRYQLVKLTLFTGLAGIALGWWLSSRMLAPIEILREEVLARADSPQRATRIDLERDDEFSDLALAFNELLERLAARNLAYEAFVADLAHELKNPVAAVRVCAESMEKASGLDATRTARIARVLGTSSRRLDALVTRFLDIARAEAGLPDAEREPFDLTALVTGLAEAVQNDERFGGVRISLTADPVQVVGVPERLETAIRNLLDNAASFSGPGGEIQVTLTVDNPDAVLAIKDSGPGIAAEDLDRVFDRFFTTRRHAKGTGLGLALTRAVIEAHDGTIHAESAPGEGARFTVRIPKNAS